MLTIIISLIAVYATWLIVKPWVSRWLRRRLERKMNEMFARQFGVDPDVFSSAGTETRRTGFPFGSGSGSASGAPRPRRRRSGKVIGRDVGEYVEFEELEGTFPAPPSTGHTPMEAQVEDAEWEEIR